MTSLGRFIIAIFVLAAITVGYFTFKSDNSPKPDAPFKIAFIGPISGNSSQVGDPIKRSVELAVEELKAKGSKVELMVVDDACDPKQASLALQKLVDVDQVKFVIGGVCNDEALALAQTAASNKVVLISPAIGLAEYSTKGEYIFRNTQPDFQGGTLLGIEAAKKYKTIAVISEANDEASAYKNAFNDAFVKGGGTVVLDEMISPKPEDFLKQAPRIKKVMPKAEAVFINLRSEASIKKFLDEFKKLYWKIPLVIYPNVANQATDIKYKVLLEGAVLAQAPSLDKTSPAVTAFIDAYIKVNKRFTGVDAYNAAGYEAIQILAGGYDSGARTADAMRDYVRGLKSFVGLQGTYQFDLRGDMQGVPFNIKTIKKGKVE
ncbi:MAG: ABC transporter substrate-binding protein [bacterium]